MEIYAGSNLVKGTRFLTEMEVEVVDGELYNLDKILGASCRITKQYKCGPLTNYLLQTDAIYEDVRSTLKCLAARTVTPYKSV